MVGSRKCPMCGRGMFRPRALWRHLIRHHPEEAIARGYHRQSLEEIKRRTKRKKERKR